MEDDFERSDSDNEEEEEEEEEEDNVFAVPERCKLKTCFAQEDALRAAHAATVADPAAFWARAASDLLPWHTPFTSCPSSAPATFPASPATRCWFPGGTLNACAACVDRWAATQPAATALVWEGDDPAGARRVTYAELLRAVVRLSRALRALGLRRGDAACVYMPTCPEAVFALLACARLGVAHCAVFVGFSARALAARVNDCGARVLLTVDATVRGTRPLYVKRTADEAAALCPALEHVLVFRQTRWLVGRGERDAASVLPCALLPPRDVWAEDAMDAAADGGGECECEPEWVPSDHPLFILYTSGSTGAPKGIVHSTGGFLAHVAASARLAFDLSAGDVFACVADVGWIASHSYAIYGALALGATSVLVAAPPLYPTASRWWEIVDRHSVTHFWSTPSAMRILAKHGEAPVAHARLDSLRLIGCVGEPIDAATWRWIFHVLGRGRCGVVDSYWLTESGGLLISPFPGCTPLKPGSCTWPFLGIDCAILDPVSLAELPGNGVEGALAIRQPWPGLAIGIVGKPGLLQETYIRKTPDGTGWAFLTGDSATRDRHGRYKITGRMDDVIKVEFQRLGTAEIENVLLMHPAVSEAAAVGVASSETGQTTVVAFVILRFEYSDSEELVESIKLHVVQHIGLHAVPSSVFVTSQLPRTRSGKVVRHLLRKIVENPSAVDLSLQDTSTLADASVLQEIVEQVKQALQQ